MAVSATPIRRTVPGDAFRQEVKISGDNSYPTGGYVLTPQQLGFSALITAVIDCDAFNLAGGAFVPIITENLASDGVTILTLQFQLEQYTTAAEVAAATNVSAANYRLLVEGK